MIKYNSWVKKLGQWHIYEEGEYETLCNKPMLGNNYVNHIKVTDREMCEECWSKYNKKEELK